MIIFTEYCKPLNFTLWEKEEAAHSKFTAEASTNVSTEHKKSGDNRQIRQCLHSSLPKKHQPYIV